jgi:SAM-dependent methyltransferase
MQADFSLTAKDYALYRAGFPDSFFVRLAELGLGLPGQDVLDVGTGTGTLARGFAARGCRVVGLDPAVALLEQAQRLSDEQSLEIEFRVGCAEHPEMGETDFDLVIAGQCWHWFDRAQAALALGRLVRPTGHLVIAHFDWLPLAGNMVRATEELIERHNPAWDMGSGSGLYPQWLTDLGEARYREIQCLTYDLLEPYTPEAWRGRIRASAGVGGCFNAAQVQKFDQELAELLLQRFPGEVLQVPHRIFAVIARPPGASAEAL